MRPTKNLDTKSKKGENEMIGISQEILEKLRKTFPPGTRVELVHMDDPYTKIPKGTHGTVMDVDDIGTIHVSWDGYCRLGVVYEEDSCRVINPDNTAKE